MFLIFSHILHQLLTHATHASRVTRAAVLRDIGVGGSAKEVVLASDVPVPTLSAGDVLVRVHASSINPLDIQMRSASTHIFIFYVAISSASSIFITS